MGRKKAIQKIGVEAHRRRNPGAYSNAMTRVHGGFVGAGLRPARSGAEAMVDAIDFSEWAFLFASRPQSRERIVAQLNAWAARHGLIRSQAQLPAFGGLTEAAMQIDRLRRQREALPADEHGKRMAIGGRLIRAWRAAALAADKMAARPAGDAPMPADDLLAEFDGV